MGKDMLVTVSGVVLNEEVRFTLGELCETCKINAEFVLEMVEEGVVEPQEGATPPEWRFDAVACKRLQMALRLQRDLRVNLPGAALALDLLEELENLRRWQSASRP